MKIYPTYKTEYSSDRLPRVERVHRIVKARTATEKLKENDFVDLEKETTSSVVDTIEDEAQDSSRQMTAYEIYEMMQAQSLARREQINNSDEESVKEKRR